jgi:hypothetical protein
MATDHILSMKLSRSKLRGILRNSPSRHPPSPRLRRILIVFIPIAAYFAEVATSATKAGSYGIFGKGESTSRMLKKSASREWMIR